MKPDYSEYLKRDGMLDFIDERWLANPWLHDGHAACVTGAIERLHPATIVEFGCGTGLLASRIRHPNYLLIDANGRCLDRAMKRNPGRNGVEIDLRNMPRPIAAFDLGVCFGVLKHFSVEEWWDVFDGLRRACGAMIFDLPVDARQDELLRDDGTEFPHVWANPAKFIEQLGSRDLEVAVDDSMFERTSELVFTVTPGGGSKL